MKRLIAVLAMIAASVFFVTPASYADPPADTPAAENAQKPPDPPPPPPKKIVKNQAPAVVNAPPANQGPQNDKEIKGLDVKDDKEIKGLEIKDDKEIKEFKEVKDDKKEKDPKVTLCHATGSESNPFVIIRVAAAAAFNGHLDHQHAEDVIPLFTFKGRTYSQNAGGDCGRVSEPPEDEDDDGDESDESDVLPDTGGSPVSFFPLGTLLVLAGSYLVGWGRSTRTLPDQDSLPIDDEEDPSGDEAAPTAMVTEPIRPTLGIKPVVLASMGMAAVVPGALIVRGRRSG